VLDAGDEDGGKKRWKEREGLVGRFYDDNFFFFCLIHYDNDSKTIRDDGFCFIIFRLWIHTAAPIFVLSLHQARPSTDFITPLAVGHLAVPPNGELAVDVE
jgi:hypothetical protein